MESVTDSISREVPILYLFIFLISILYNQTPGQNLKALKNKHLKNTMRKHSIHTGIFLPDVGLKQGSSVIRKTQFVL